MLGLGLGLDLGLGLRTEDSSLAVLSSVRTEDNTELWTVRAHGKYNH